MKPTILVADDELGIRELLVELLQDIYNVTTAQNGLEAYDLLKKEKFDLILLDLRMPKMTGLEVIKKIHDEKIPTTVICVTADKDINSAIHAIKLGAFDYVVKPFDNDKMLVLIKNALEKSQLQKQVQYLKNEISTKYSFKNIIGTSRAMQKIYSTINKVINNNSTVLITGESGTGKELIARAIHYNGHRQNGPFIAVDCASIPDTLIENELFGHEKGAFTGANVRQIGKFELANKGSLFLDEIGNLRLDIQAKLLRVLQEFEITRVGGNKRINVDIRIIAATNANLEKKISEGSFREDLYYRLNVVNIKLPPLRKREEDIVLLTNAFTEQYNKEFHKNEKMTKEVLDLFLAYKWPGNVRELKNTVQRLVLISESEQITPDLLDKKFIKTTSPNSSSIIKVGMSMEEAELALIRETIKSTNHNLSKTARILGITRKTLHNKINRYPELLKD